MTALLMLDDRWGRCFGVWKVGRLARTNRKSGTGNRPAPHFNRAPLDDRWVIREAPRALGETQAAADSPEFGLDVQEMSEELDSSDSIKCHPAPTI